MASAYVDWCVFIQLSTLAKPSRDARIWLGMPCTGHIVACATACSIGGGRFVVSIDWMQSLSPSVQLIDFYINQQKPKVAFRFTCWRTLNRPYIRTAPTFSLTLSPYLLHHGDDNSRHAVQASQNASRANFSLCSRISHSRIGRSRLRTITCLRGLSWWHALVW